MILKVAIMIYFTIYKGVNSSVYTEENSGYPVTMGNTGIGLRGVGQLCKTQDNKCIKNVFLSSLRIFLMISL
jgi:hypothetical protein